MTEKLFTGTLNHNQKKKKKTFYVQCYSVLSVSTAHKSVNGVNLYNILDLNDNLDIKIVELGIKLPL